MKKRLKRNSNGSIDGSKQVSVRKIQSQLSMDSSNDQKVDVMSISLYQEWFDIMVNDDKQSADIILKTTTESEQQLLLNSPFEFEDYQGFGLNEEINNKVDLPFHIAIVSCSAGVADIMMKFGSNVTEINGEGNNVLHSAVITSFNRPEIEKDICETVIWLCSQTNTVEVSNLLFHENNDGLRPIEFAAQQGCLKLMKTLLETSGHVTSEVIRGHGIYRMHDISEYEIGNRHALSPINMLAYLDKKTLKDPELTEILLSPLFTDWINRKLKCNIPLIAFWFFLRLTFVTVFIVLDLDIHWLEIIHGNDSSRVICEKLSYVNIGASGTLILTCILLGYCVIVLTVYVIEIVSFRKSNTYMRKAHDLHGKKTFISNVLFFRLAQLSLVVVILLSCVQGLDLITTGYVLNNAAFLVNDIARSFIPVLCLWSMSFFLQIIPGVGPSIISIQGMLLDMARFMLLFAIMLLPFVHVFESFSLANSEQGCVDEFRSMYETSYTLFRMMLNMYDPSGLQMRNVFILYILHILYIFMVGVLLINFLIAMMSKKASDVAENEQVVFKINQLALVDLLENRVYAINSFGKWIYKHLTKRTFHCTDGKVCIKSTQSRFAKMYSEKKRKTEYLSRQEFFLGESES